MDKIARLKEILESSRCAVFFGGGGHVHGVGDPRLSQCGWDIQQDAASGVQS